MMRWLRKTWTAIIDTWGTLTLLFALVIFIEMFRDVEPIVAQLLQ